MVVHQQFLHHIMVQVVEEGQQQKGKMEQVQKAEMVEMVFNVTYQEATPTMAAVVEVVLLVLVQQDKVVLEAVVPQLLMEMV